MKKNIDKNNLHLDNCYYLKLQKGKPTKTLSSNHYSVTIIANI